VANTNTSPPNNHACKPFDTNQQRLSGAVTWTQQEDKHGEPRHWVCTPHPPGGALSVKGFCVLFVDVYSFSVEISCAVNQRSRKSDKEDAPPRSRTVVALTRRCEPSAMRSPPVCAISLTSLDEQSNALCKRFSASSAPLRAWRARGSGTSRHQSASSRRRTQRTGRL
jgi:hypothetical protein